MKVQSTQWTHTQRALAFMLGCDAETIAELNALVEQIAAAPRPQQHRLTSQLMDLLGDLPNAHDLGFVFGKQIPITSYGELSIGLRIAPTFEHALRLIAKHHHRATPLVHYGYVRNRSEGRFTVGFRCEIGRRGEAFLLCAIVSLLVFELGRMTGGRGKVKRVELTHSSKGWTSAYRRHVGVDAQAGFDANSIVLDREVLELPNPFADAETFERLVSSYEQTALLEDAPGDPATRIRELVMASIAKPPTLKGLGKSLGLTSRQVRLLLTRSRSSYREIVRSCRVEYATALLKDPSLSISQVAERLGYSDLAAFTHGFTRWTGASPSAVRKHAPR